MSGGVNAATDPASTTATTLALAALPGAITYLSGVVADEKARPCHRLGAARLLIMIVALPPVGIHGGHGDVNRLQMVEES